MSLVKQKHDNANAVSNEAKELEKEEKIRLDRLQKTFLIEKQHREQLSTINMQSLVLKKNQPVHSNTDRIAKPVDKKYVKPAEKQESAPEVKK